MLRLPATEGNFQVIGVVNSPPDQFGYEAQIPLSFAADLIIASVINQQEKPWVRGGRVFQAWDRGDIFVFSRNNWINLDTPTLIEVEPVAQSLIRYEPPGWLGPYTLVVEARPYLNPFTYYT
ncbi:hypothetical protein [Picosynechococcus sp. PCC 73109]|uniref:hypothetical protein n=1 Tax=Picosynechococcus sp. PCC 73109 TaxID=374982 RepID=UPI000A98CB9D|nr:hypothetical protein [Picosynechococcus sp. PCC 73109]